MNEEKAREILGEIIAPDNSLISHGYPYIQWSPGDIEILIDGRIDCDALEAIAWWVKNKAEE